MEHMIFRYWVRWNKNNKNYTTCNNRIWIRV